MEAEVGRISYLGDTFSDQEVFDRVMDMAKARQALVRLYLVSIDFSSREFCSGVARAVYSKMIPSWYMGYLDVSSNFLFSPALLHRIIWTGLPISLQ